jgi:hypothetical protein
MPQLIVLYMPSLPTLVLFVHTRCGLPKQLKGALFRSRSQGTCIWRP